MSQQIRAVIGNRTPVHRANTTTQLTKVKPQIRE